MLDWIERKQRIFPHFMPTSASWANLAERFFATLTDKQIRRGVSTSVPHLAQCLREYLKRHDENPQPPRVDQITRRDEGEGRTRPRQTGRCFLTIILFRTAH